MSRTTGVRRVTSNHFTSTLQLRRMPREAKTERMVSRLHVFDAEREDHQIVFI